MKSFKPQNGNYQHHNTKNAPLQLALEKQECQEIDNCPNFSDTYPSQTAQLPLNGNSSSPISAAAPSSDNYIELSYTLGKAELKECIKQAYFKADRSSDLIIEISDCYSTSDQEVVFGIFEKLGLLIRKYSHYFFDGKLVITMPTKAHQTCNDLLSSAFLDANMQVSSLRQNIRDFSPVRMTCYDLELYAFPDQFYHRNARKRPVHTDSDGTPHTEKQPDGSIRPGYFNTLRELQGVQNYPEILAEYGVSEGNPDLARNWRHVLSGTSFTTSLCLTVKVYPVTKRIELRVFDYTNGNMLRNLEQLFILLAAPLPHRNITLRLARPARPTVIQPEDAVRAILTPLIFRILLSIRDGCDLLRILDFDRDSADIELLAQELRGRTVPNWLVCNRARQEIPSLTDLINLQNAYGNQRAAIIATIRGVMKQLFELKSYLAQFDFDLLESWELSVMVIDLVEVNLAAFEIITDENIPALEVEESIHQVSRAFEESDSARDTIIALQTMPSDDVEIFLNVLEPTQVLNYSKENGFASGDGSVRLPAMSHFGLTHWVATDGELTRLEDGQIPTKVTCDDILAAQALS